MFEIETTKPTFDCRWRARLDVQIVATRFGSRLGRRKHGGPLRIQRPFFPEGPDVLHLYLLHPPGGVVGGDCLDTRIEVTESAHAVITTPAAQKLYRSAAAESELHTEIALEGGASAEWLPMETIVFDGARSRSHSIVRLAPTSRYIGWEIVCFGRPASEVRFDSGQYRSSLEVLLDDRPLLIEHARVRGGGRELAGPWGYADYPVSATWLCVAPDTSALGQITDEVRATLSGRPELRAAISHFDGAVVLRIQSKSVEAARRVLVAAWAQARPSIMGRSACEPRIWHT